MQYVDATAQELIEMTFNESEPQQNFNLPETAAAGDSGELPPLISEDGSFISRTWSAEDAGNGLLNIVENMAHQYNDGSIYHVSIIRHTIG
ncbi:MAG: hypothetical protein GY874_15365 [Desulfobacteraceae bacterium]|nr:hypothetical protein [Desulfobacteraceae bacterium]